MAENGKLSLSVLSIDKAELVCEKEFGHLLEPDSAARYGDPYAKYIDNAMVRLDGMAAYAACLLEGYAAAMTVSRVFTGWRNRLQAVRDCKENMRVFSRSEKEIVSLFRQFCRESRESADRASENGGENGAVVKENARQRMEGALYLLGELFTVPEIYEIIEKFAIPRDEGNRGKDAEKPEKTIRITVDLTEKEALAYEIVSRVEQKIRTAVMEAEREKE